MPKVKVPPVKATLPPVVFVTVSIFAELVVPTGTLPKARGLGLTLAVGAGGVPVPLRATGEPLTGTLPVMDSVPLTDPVIVGEKTTLIVQVAPPARLVPQVPPAAPVGREYTVDENVREIAVRFAPPLFDSVSVWGVLLLPVATEPKEREVGETLAIA